jgi:hypothetical protein
MGTANRISGVASWGFEDRLAETINRAQPMLAPEVRAQVTVITSPEGLKIIAGVLVAWVAAHAIGIGELVDVIIGVTGVFAIGLAVFDGLDHLYDFAAGAYRARIDRELDVAADHLAKAIGILGIQAVLAVLFRGAPRTGAGGRIQLPPPPPRTPGARYRPTARSDATMRASEGETSAWGDIRFSTQGTLRDQQIALLHEKVHRFLTPKLYALRNFRVRNVMASYVRSSLRRYLEEALAEVVAQVGVNGFRKVWAGIRFPVKEGYVYWIRRGGAETWMEGNGLLREIAGLLATGSVMGIDYEIWISR